MKKRGISACRQNANSFQSAQLYLHTAAAPSSFQVKCLLKISSAPNKPAFSRANSVKATTERAQSQQVNLFICESIFHEAPDSPVLCVCARLWRVCEVSSHTGGLLRAGSCRHHYSWAAKGYYYAEKYWALSAAFILPSSQMLDTGGTSPNQSGKWRFHRYWHKMYRWCCNPALMP